MMIEARSGPLQGVPARDRYGLNKVNVTGGTLAYGSWHPRTESTNVAVVALHGITGNHRCWSFLAHELDDTVVVAPDLRGRGGSSSLGSPFGLAQHADDTIALLDAVGAESVVIVGHSMGAYVALVTADRYPDRVRGLVLVDGGFPLSTGQSDDGGAEGREITAGLERRLATTYPNATTAVRYWRQHPAFANAWSRVAEDYARYDLGGQKPYLRARVQRECLLADSEDIATGTDLRAALDRLRHPAQWLTAPRGLLNEVPALYPPEAVTHWREAYPQLDVHPVDEVNHYTIVLSRRGSHAIAAGVRRAAAMTSA